MQFFYAPDITNADEIALNEKESHHLMHVLRAQPGDVVALTSGKGILATATVISLHHKHCFLKIAERRNYTPSVPLLHMAIAPVKSGDRLDFLLEKMTEIGVGKITFILTQNSERRKLNAEKEQLTLIAAIKQSGRPFLPLMEGLTDFRTFIRQTSCEQRFIAHCREGEKPLLSKVLLPKKDTLICIGPEGDFTAEEINFALENGVNPVSLGISTLRTETAGIVACNTFQLINQISE